MKYTDPDHPTLPTSSTTSVRDGQAAEYKQVAESKYDYDKFGNLTKQKARRYSSADWLEREYQYSDNGRLLEKDTGPMGLAQAYTYNDVQTQLKTSTEHKDGGKEMTTSYEFDKLGRPAKTTYPDRTVATTSYEWVKGQAIGSTQPIYRVATTATNSPGSSIFYDGLNREVASIQQGLNGAMVYVEKTYDSFGRLSKISDPYKTGEAVMYTETTYDGADRPTKIQQPNGGETTYEYRKYMPGQNEGYAETITQPGMKLIRIYNTPGELIEATDPGGTISYAYRADGQPKSTTAPGGVSTLFEYDEYGRQTKLVDPSAGT